MVQVISAKADAIKGPEDIAVNRSHVWVQNYGVNSVTELNAGDRSLVRVIE